MKFYGVEAEFNWTPFQKLVLFGNYSFLQNEYSKDAVLPNAILLELPPRNKGKLSMRYSLPLKTRLAFDLKVIGERKGEKKDISLDRYAVTDISFEKSLPCGMSAGFFINNLFGMDYQQVYGFPSPGRTFGLRLQVTPTQNLLAKK